MNRRALVLAGLALRYVKTQVRGGPVLTTQLYFPGEARGADRALVVKPGPAGPVRTVLFDFLI